MFSLPPPPGEQVEGETDEKPIELTGIAADEFECFLEVLYPKDFCISELTGTNCNAWISILKVATLWDFPSVRNFAIAEFSILDLPTAERIAIGKHYNAEGWLASAYTDLCIRAEPLSLKEEQKLGVKDVLKIYYLRREIVFTPNLWRNPDGIWKLVRKEFTC